MTQFAECYLLIFGQLAVGGIVALAVPPFATIERGFYKSSASVFVACTAAYLTGRIALAFRPRPVPFGALEAVLWGAFMVAASLYLASLWTERVRLRARAYAATLLLGVVALAVSGANYRVGAAISLAGVFYPLAFLTGALALGAVATGMLLGHWYLIDLGLSIVPLRRLFRYFVWTVLLHLAVLGLAIVVIGVSAGAVAVAALWHEHAALLAARFLLGPFAALALAWMIDRTLRIPQTMAATGLFYIAILFVLVGELLGRLILFRTSLPL